MLIAKPEQPATKIRSLKNAPFLKRWPISAGGLFLAASLGLHSLLLALPLASPPDAEPEQVEPESLEITVLPAPVPVVEPVTPSAATVPPVQVPAQVPIQAQPTTRPVIQPVLQPTPSPAAPPAKAEELPISDSEPPTPPSPLEEEVPPSPYQDFPHLAEATSGCQGVAECWRSPASSWRAAAGALREQLETQGYQLENITDQIVSEDTGVRIYAVARNGTPEYYLHLISVAGGVLYTLAQEPLTADAIAAIEKF